MRGRERERERREREKEGGRESEKERGKERETERGRGRERDGEVYFQYIHVLLWNVVYMHMYTCTRLLWLNRNWGKSCFGKSRISDHHL